MSERPFGDFPIVTDENIGHGDVWIGPAGATCVPTRLLEAFTRGETTPGGLAEAGWRFVGRLDESSPTFKSTPKGSASADDR
ncbi:hypothetical protein [Mycolicibacterium sphagni]|uniref:hypothetical protein n=1 Tax=Mycolicibacterium sphagni TaxID=1786 RepID=UPI0021F34A89|nr:hypothetical protein [Mycolicibacterium sphagni]MCV7174876.1 hypothetical protein [Mycolicibacterium sphagni]